MTDGDGKGSDQFKTMILLSFSGRLRMAVEIKGRSPLLESIDQLTSAPLSTAEVRRL